MNNPETLSAERGADSVQRLVRPEIAIRYRVRALCLSWRSSALWKHHDSEMTDDETEKLACRREAQAYEQCAYHLEQACRDWPNNRTERQTPVCAHDGTKTI